MMNKDNRNDKIRKIAKKGLTFSLCAVLAGGLAAGSFEGVNKLAGWSGATTVEAASNKDETTLTYAKSEMPVIPNQIPAKIQAAQQKEALMCLKSYQKHFHLLYLLQPSQFRRYRITSECMECMDMRHSSRNRK
jgi:hypothetical protein